MSAGEAEEGKLTQTLVESAQRSGLRRGAVRGLDAIIESRLAGAERLKAAELPGTTDQALLAMADFAVSHPRLALRLDATEGELVWDRALAVEIPRRLAQPYNSTTAVESLASLLALKEQDYLALSDDLVGIFGSLRDPVLPPRMLVAATDGEQTAVDEELLRSVSRLNRTRGDGGRLALLVVPNTTASTITPAQQRQLATSVVIVRASDIAAAAQDVDPRRVLVDLVLRQADLTKANPFTVMGVAGREVFYGRGQEDAMLQNTLQTNSAALIGGRRIGKTSLLQQARSRLQDAGFNVKYADCQAVDSWSTLAKHAELHWGVEVSDDFSAGAVDELIAQLMRGHNGSLIVMLDEVDNLLRWDTQTNLNGMNEPLFRALRSVSQEGVGQFVFSGERLIAQVLWDPGSPHWNFCRAIPVRQLGRSDAEALFINPISALGVEAIDPAATRQELWDATSGHPQLVQQLGEFVVVALNDRPSEQRLTLGSGDVQKIASNDSFKRHYVQTYWGQATTQEKLFTALLAQGATSVDELMSALQGLGVQVPLDTLQYGLRMLDLYGVVDYQGSAVSWRADYFPQALESLGGSQLIVEDCVRSLG